MSDSFRCRIVAHPEIDAALVEQAQDGDGQAREQIMAQLEPMLGAYFTKMLYRYVSPGGDHRK